MHSVHVTHNIRSFYFIIMIKKINLIRLKQKFVYLGSNILSLIFSQQYGINRRTPNMSVLKLDSTTENHIPK